MVSSNLKFGTRKGHGFCQKQAQNRLLILRHYKRPLSKLSKKSLLALLGAATPPINVILPTECCTLMCLAVRRAPQPTTS